MQAYSTANLMFHLTSKKNKFVLMLCSTRLFRSYLESILVFAYKERHFEEKVYFFEIDHFDDEIFLQKYEFTENSLKLSDNHPRKIKQISR